MPNTSIKLSKAQQNFMDDWLYWRLEEWKVQDDNCDYSTMSSYIETYEPKSVSWDDEIYIEVKKHLDVYIGSHPVTDMTDENYNQMKPESLKMTFDEYWKANEFMKLCKKRGLEENENYKDNMKLLKWYEYCNYRSKKVHPARKALFLQLKTQKQRE